MSAVDQEARQEPLRLQEPCRDRRHKLVRRYQVSDAATHDSKVLDDILDGDNTALGVWADSAYRSAEIGDQVGKAVELANAPGPVQTSRLPWSLNPPLPAPTAVTGRPR